MPPPHYAVYNAPCHAPQLQRVIERLDLKLTEQFDVRSVTEGEVDRLRQLLAQQQEAQNQLIGQLEQRAASEAARAQEALRRAEDQHQARILHPAPCTRLRIPLTPCTPTHCLVLVLQPHPSAPPPPSLTPT